MARFSLKPSVQVIRGTQGGFIISPDPAVVLKVNPAAVELLTRCDGRVTEVGGSAARFLEQLAERGLVYLHPQPPETGWPRVSVVVPVRNRADDIRDCVASLLALNYPADRLEIVVVDDASTDATPQVLAGLPVRWLRLPQPSGPAAARNAGARVAQGEIIAFTDSDCVVDPLWLRELVPYLCQPQVGIVGGRVEPFALDTALNRYEAVKSPLFMGLEEGECRPNSAIPFLPTCNFLIWRHLWAEMGGFDEAFPIGEDVDLVWRVHDAGYRVRYVPRGCVRHKYRDRLDGFVRRRAFYGGSEALLLLKHRDKRKVLWLPWLRGLAALCLWLAWRGRNPTLALGTALAAGWEGWRIRRHLARFGVPGSGRLAARWLVARYEGWLYHLTGNVARYYSLPLLAGAVFVRALRPVVLLAFLYPIVRDFVRLRPALSLPRFAGFYALEFLAHQVGMLRRCVQRRSIRPLVPRLRLW